MTKATELRELASLTTISSGQIQFDTDIKISGDLITTGNTITITADTLNISDPNITLASGAANSALADGAGITIDGAGVILSWNDAQSTFDSNKPLALRGASAGRYTALHIVNETNANATESAIQFSVVDPSNNACDVRLVAYRDGANAGSDFYIESTNSSNTIQRRFSILESGDVGIGTDNPTYKLDVAGQGQFKTVDGPTLTLDSDTVGNPYVMFKGTTSGSYQQMGWVGYQWNTPNYLELWSQNDGIKLKVGTTSGQGVWIDTSNKVGIGTDAPVHELDVNGAIATRQVRHSIAPTLNLDFANSKQLDPRITFYRDSIASYYDSKGILRYANENEPRFNHDPVTGESKGLLIEEERNNKFYNANKGYWGDASRGHLDFNSEVAPDGTYSAVRFSSDAVNQDHYAIASLTNSMYDSTGIWVFSVYVKAYDSYGQNLRIRFNVPGSTRDVYFDLVGNGTCNITDGSADIEYVGNGWYRCWEHNTATSTGNGFIAIWANDANAYQGDYSPTFAIWGAQVEKGSYPTSYFPTITDFISRASDATYHDENGDVRSVPYNAPRYSYRHNGRKWVETGLLLENGATNLYSTGNGTDVMFSTTGSCTLTNNFAHAPDGTFTAQRFTWNNGYGYRYWPNVHGNGVIHTHSYYIKPISGTSDTRHSIGGTPGSATWTLNFDTQTMEQVSGDGTTYEYSFEKMRNGWWRVSVSFSLPGATGYVELQWSGTGSGVEYYLWGMQVETGRGATSFIYSPDYQQRTRAADVFANDISTRDNDIVEMDDAEDIIPQPVGTVYTEWSTNEKAGEFGGIFEIQDAGTNGIDHRFTSSAVQYYVSDNNAISAGAAHVPGEYRKTALAYDLDSTLDTRAVSEGVLQGVNTSNVWDLHLKKIRLGSIDFNPAYQLNGHLKSFRLYPERITDDELKALTENN